MILFLLLADIIFALMDDDSLWAVEYALSGSVFFVNFT